MVLLSLGVTSCTVRMGTEMRPAPPSPIPIARAVPTPVARSPARVLRKRTLPRRTEPSRGTSNNDSSVAQLCVDEINRYRATLGLRALERASDREGCADGQIRDDAQSGNWHGRFGACGESAQNECNSSPTAQGDFIKGCLRGMWNEGPGGGHYENMKSASATTVWCGFYTEPSGGVWSVQDFR